MKPMESLLSAEELAALLGHYGDHNADDQMENESHSDNGVQECEKTFTQKGDAVSSDSNSH